MNPMLPPLLIAFGLAWCIGLWARDKRWAFACWLPFTIACSIGSLLFLGSLFLLFEGAGPGAANGFYALGMQLMALWLLLAPILLFVSIQFRPRHYPPLVVAGTVTALVAGVIVASRVVQP